MPEAVVVENLYKKFGRSQPALWQRFLRREALNGHNGTSLDEKMTLVAENQASANGHKKLVIALDTSTQLKHTILWKDGREPTLEDVFLELTGKKLVNKEEEPEEVQV